MWRRRLRHLREKIEKTERQLQDSHEAEQQVAEAHAVFAIRENPKYFYKYAQPKAKIRTSVGPLKHNDVLVGDDQGMCELLRAQFEKYSANPDTQDRRTKLELFKNFQGGRS
jgi:hypothetical protein